MPNRALIAGGTIPRPGPCTDRGGYNSFDSNVIVRAKIGQAMLAALNIAAVGLGVGAGGLSATVAALAISGILSLAGVERGADIGLFAGVMVGLAMAGWVAGRLAKHSERFHGAVSGLLLAGLVIVLAVLGGSPASTISVLWLALLSSVVAGTTGWLAGRRKRAAP